MTDPKSLRDAAARTGANAIDAVKGTARTTAQRAAQKAASGVEGNPLSVLIGGLTIGVLAGALLPRTDREAEILGPVGKKLTEGATAAARAARDAGVSELAAAGISREAAREQVSRLIDGVVSAARSAGDAAAKPGKADR